LFRDQCGIHVALTDWAKLSQFSCLSTTPTPAASNIFYASGTDQDEHERPRCRTKELFADVSDDDYTKVYQLVLDNPHLRFPDIHAFLKISKAEGKLINAIMTHVGQWLNDRPFLVLDRTASKPPLRHDFIPSLSKKHGCEAEAVSIDLQRRIAVWVKAHMKDLTSASLVHLIQEYPVAHSGNYCERFQHETWSSILNLVYDVCGPHFHGSVMQHFNSAPPHRPSNGHVSSLPSIVSHSLSGLPEVSRNPVLSRKAALEDLAQHLQPSVAQWVVRQCSSALEESWRWPEHTQAILREDIERFRAMAGSPVEEESQQVPIPGPKPLSNCNTSEPPRQKEAPAMVVDEDEVIRLEAPQRPSTRGTQAAAQNASRKSSLVPATTPIRSSAPQAAASACQKAFQPSASPASLTLSRQSYDASRGIPSSAAGRQKIKHTLDGSALSSLESSKRRKIATSGGSGWRKTPGIQPRHGLSSRTDHV
jgi:hypothetical protein